VALADGPEASLPAAGLRWLLLGNVGCNDSCDDTPLGMCVEIEGLFRDRAAPAVAQVRLLGCRPEPPLLTALKAIGQTTRAAERRRRVRAEVHVVAADGAAGRLVGAVVSGTIQAGESSRAEPDHDPRRKAAVFASAG
jgi:hypothetical protein